MPSSGFGCTSRRGGARACDDDRRDRRRALQVRAMLADRRQRLGELPPSTSWPAASPPSETTPSCWRRSPGQARRLLSVDVTYLMLVEPDGVLRIEVVDGSIGSALRASSCRSGRGSVGASSRPADRMRRSTTCTTKRSCTSRTSTKPRAANASAGSSACRCDWANGPSSALRGRTQAPPVLRRRGLPAHGTGLARIPGDQRRTDARGRSTQRPRCSTRPTPRCARWPMHRVRAATCRIDSSRSSWRSGTGRRPRHAAAAMSAEVCLRTLRRTWSWGSMATSSRTRTSLDPCAEAAGQPAGHPRPVGAGGWADRERMPGRASLAARRYPCR